MVEPLGPPVEQPAIISDMVPATKTGIALIMGLFAVKIILCRAWSRGGADNSSHLVRGLFANKLIGAKPHRPESNRCRGTQESYGAKPRRGKSNRCTVSWEIYPASKPMGHSAA
jgi:hypothetical protein